MSGLNTQRGIPVLFSTFKTLKGGTISHWLTACGETPTRRANSFDDPAALIASSRGVIFSHFRFNLSEIKPSFIFYQVCLH